MVKFAVLSKKTNMKNTILGLLALMLFATVQVKAQKTGAFVFTVANDTIYGSEFERVFSKNSKPGKIKPTPEELEEYLQLYIKFKLKVKEAYALKMDTNYNFKTELAGYRKQLALPYLTDKEVTDQLIQEAYDRMKTEIKVSHIMVRLSTSAIPKDTLEAYKKIMQFRDKITNQNMSFDTAAFNYSEDESAKFNFGDLGYFSTFAMIYPFENMAYTTPIGEVSMPFRTQFGYHIIIVKDKRPARGDVKAAHLMIRFNNESEVEAAKKKIDAIYEKIKAGEDFNTLVQQFSEDFGTRSRNGELNWVNSTSGNVPVVFRETAFGLNAVGDLSAPVKSEFGWHLIKLLERKPMVPFDELKETIKYQVQRDQRSEKNKEVVLVRIKKENKFIETLKALDKFTLLADTGITGANWVSNDALVRNDMQPLFSINAKIYTYGDFVGYIKSANKSTTNKETAIKTWYTDFVNSSNLAYEEANLESKFSDFNYLMQEYRDGILLFDLTDKMVWTKSVEDTAGLKSFFLANNSKYMWNERANIESYTCKDEKTSKKVQKYIGKGYDKINILSKMNGKDPETVKVETKLIEKGDKAYTNIEWKNGIQMMPSLNSEVSFINILTIQPPAPKALGETLGMATTDYQTYLENTWITQLQEKYPVIVNPHGLEQLFK
jgi:peptidyl-prolyl cis-trans isomerase SurA